MQADTFTVYVDGIYDLAHPGHLNFLNRAYEKAEALAGGRSVKLLVGVNDEGVADYKRQPIMSAAERVDAVRALIPSGWESEVLTEGVPLRVSKAFMDDHDVDLVVHGDDFDVDSQRHWYGAAIDEGKFATVPYTKGVSTSALVTAVKVHGVAGFRLLGVQPRTLTIDAHELSSRIQDRSWVNLGLEDPQAGHGTVQRLRGWLARRDHDALKDNHTHAARYREDPSIFNAVWLSWYCLKSAVTGGAQLGTEIVTRAGSSVRHLRNDMGNPQRLFARVAELAKDTLGCFVATPLALYSEEAARAFVVKGEEYMIPALTADQAADGYAIGYAVTRFLDRHNLEYRMTSGTFLGAIRHEGEIPWDDDEDYLLDPRETQRMQQLLDDGTFQRETGLQWMNQPKSGGWQFFFEDGEPQADIMGGCLKPFVDLFATREKDGKITYKSAGMRALASNEYYTREEWDNKRRYTFGPFEIWGPMDPSAYFLRCFRADALETAYQTVHHDTFQVKAWPQRVVVSEQGPIVYNEERYQRRLEAMPQFTRV